MEFQHELVLPNDDLPFKLFTFEGRSGNYVREKHWHRSIEIFAVFEGDLRFFINNQKYPLKAGEFMIVNSNEVHSVVTKTPNLTVVLQIPLKLFTKYFTTENYIRFSHGAQNQDKRIMEQIRDIYQTYNEKRCGYELKVQSIFFMLVYLLVTKYRKLTVSAEEIKSNRRLNHLTSITDYIRENYDRELPLQTVAKIFGYSPTYLSHMFQTYAKTNYKAYIQSIRLERAYAELLDTDHNIGKIAEDHGFANSKAFSREFSRKYGILPSEYRKQHADEMRRRTY